MIRRLIIAVVVVSVCTPIAAAADASLFGPPTSGTGTGRSDAQSTNLLQPAGTSDNPLQTASPGGATQSAVQDQLQAPANSEALRVYLQGETEGGNIPEEDGPNLLVNGFIALVAMLAAIGAGMLWRRHLSTKPHARLQSAPDQEPIAEAAATAAAAKTSEPAKPVVRKKPAKSAKKKRKKTKK